MKLYSSSAAILERVADGRFSLGYNILGTYAKAWARTAPDLGIILPEDYTVVMSRVAMVPRAARNPALGTRFLRFLLSQEGQTVLADQSQLNALNPAVSGPNTTSALRRRAGGKAAPHSPGAGAVGLSRPGQARPADKALEPRPGRRRDGELIPRYCCVFASFASLPAPG